MTGVNYTISLLETINISKHNEFKPNNTKKIQIMVKKDSEEL